MKLKYTEKFTEDYKFAAFIVIVDIPEVGRFSVKIGVS